MIGCGALTIGGMLRVGAVTAAASWQLRWMRARSCCGSPSRLSCQSFYATSDRLLIIAGQANVALLVTASSFALLIAIPFVTAPWLGPVAIPAAMILAIAVVNPLVAVRARQLVGVSTIHWRDAIFMACGSVALAAAAVAGTYLSAAVACAMLAAIGAYYVTTALSRSSGDDYDNSLIFAARESAVNAPLALSDKARNRRSACAARCCANRARRAVWRILPHRACRSPAPRRSRRGGPPTRRHRRPRNSVRPQWRSRDAPGYR